MHRILHVEDDARDAELVAAQLELLPDHEIVWVSDAGALQAALESERFDAALCDLRIPGLEEAETFARIQGHQPGLPVIAVSGVVGEEAAVDLIKRGYTDYVLKDRLARLVPAVSRAIEEARERNQRRAAEQALRRSELRLRFLLDRMPIVVWTLDRDLRIRSVLGGGLDELPFYPTDVVGLPLTDLPIPSVGEMTRQLRQAVAGTGVKFETAHEGRWFETHAVPLFGSESEEVVMALTADVTDRRTLEQQSVSTQRLEAVGQLAGRLAHDFNNMLAVVMAETDQLRGTRPAPDELERALDVLSGAAERAAELTRQLLTLGRQRALTPERLPLADVVQGCAELLRSACGPRVELSIDAGSANTQVRADRSALEQILVNLCVNARDALPDGGRVAIALSDEWVDPGSTSWVWAPARGHNACITVADDGGGMDEFTRARIFEPYFTTKGPQRGTGLGLASVYGLVRQSHGGVWVASQTDVGTVFKVYLPADPARAEGPPPPDGAALRDRSVLLVEPDVAAREYCRAVLAGAGASVTVAADESEGLLAARRSPRPVDALVCDMFLPGAEGVAVLEQLRKQRPDVAVVFCSGLPAWVLEAVPGLPGHTSLAKPVHVNQLLRALEESLPGRTRSA